MKALAEFVMRGRVHAIGASMVCASLPILNWLSTSIVSLVVLHRGGVEGSLVLLCALLPMGVVIYLTGVAPTPLIALLGTVGLAYVLRVTISWEITLVLAVVFSAIGILIFESTSTERLKSIVEWYMEFTQQDSTEQSFETVRKVILAVFAMGQAFAMLAFLMLARWWQSQLYNPGGFQKEFHQLRITWGFSTGIVLLLVICYVFNDSLGQWMLLLTVPLLLSGLGMVHWLIGYRKMSVRWLIIFYFLLLVFSNFFYPLVASLALIDSFLDVRKRIQTTKV